MKRLTRQYFANNTLEVAKDLIGKEIFFYSYKGIITETEAYIGQGDPACHASKGLTPRTKVMFGPAGFSYVYLIYGMYHCLNFVTEAEGYPAAVLIRGIYLPQEKKLLDGPGKLCKYLGLNRQDHNNLDITTHSNFGVNDVNIRLSYDTTPRVGISCGQDKLWRFVNNFDLSKLENFY